MFKMIVPVIASFLLLTCGSRPQDQQQFDRVKVGAQVLIEEYLDELEGKNIGLVMNPTARIEGTHMLDTLLSLGVNVTALFAPEHGFRGEAGAGEIIEDGIDQATGLPVYSLYGETRKPTPAMLQGVDLLLFDMQDVGARFYTYNVTLGLLLEAAAQTDIPVWVLDRPNPAGGDYVEGWILEERYQSFVGAYPIPMVHGMTLGELAQMMIGERWIEYEATPELRVIAMDNWNRSMKWPDTGLSWNPPSPNLPTFEHAYLYLGTVLIEGTGISEGRGTDDPFLNIGSPATSIPDEELEMLREKYPGMEIERTVFEPRSIPGKSLYPKHEGEVCTGVALRIVNYEGLNPVAFGIDLLEVMLRSTKDAGMEPFIFNLAGSGRIRDFDTRWSEGVDLFKEERQPYLLY